MSLEVSERKSWSDLRTPDVYFSYEYHLASARLECEGTEPVLLELSSETGTLRLPLLLRPINGRYWDATSCYGYGGPWIEGDVDRAAARRVIDEWAADRGVVCTFLRLHPAARNRALAATFAEVTDLNHTVLWPTDPGVDLLAGMKKKHRQYTRKSEREGLAVQVESAPSELGVFIGLYEESMDRLDAEGFYHFPASYWEALLEGCRERIVLSTVSHNGAPVVSLLCLVGERYLHAHLLGTNEVGREKKGNYLAYYAAAKWGQENGRFAFHLGGGYGGDGTDLLAWKQGFCPGSEPTRFSISKAVHDPSMYRILAGGDSIEGYFPPWRARS